MHRILSAAPKGGATWARACVAVAAVAAFVVSGSPAPAGTDTLPGQTGNEPHTAVVNPRNPAQVAVGRGCTVTISNDFGATFPITRNTTAGCNGDISLAFDSQGRLFVSHLDRQGGDNELTVLAGRINDTTTPGSGTYTPVVVSADDGNDDDKEWLAADANPSSPYRDNLYLAWTRFSGTRRIMFARSVDGGANWSAPQVVSADGEGFVWPSHVAVGPNGDVYVGYHTDTCGGAGGGSVQLLRDGFGGQNLAAGTVPQKTTVFGAGQAQVTCNVQDGDGDEIPGADFWLQGTAQPWVLPDPARAGNVYVVANDDPNDAFASGDDADVVIARSSDNGQSFTLGRVDHGPGQSFAVMPTAAIDQDGDIAVHWYDNRNNRMNTGANANFGAPNFLLDLYGTASVDGGMTFANDFRINDAPFDPDVSAPCRFGSLPTNDCTERIGEYNGVWSVDGIGYAAWTGNATPPAAPFPSDGSGAQTTMFDLFSMIGAFPDRFEPNESIDFAVVASLGADHQYNQSRLSIHNDADADYFKVVALDTGKLSAEIQYNERVADLRIRAIDRFGNAVATGSQQTLQPGSTVETLAIPAVSGQPYFLEVLDPNAPATAAPQSTYDISIVNRPAPVPFGLNLLAASDSGRSDIDDVTNDNTPSIRLRVDDADLLDEGIAFSPTDDGVLADDPPGFKVRVLDDGSLATFATPVVGQSGSYEATLPAMADGEHAITAQVVIVDPSDGPALGIVHVVGGGGESNALDVRIDTTAPAQPSTPDLLATSDGAGVNIDNITPVVQPAFAGTAEANSLVRILANGVVVGQGLAGGDASDGVPGDGLGAYEITTGPLDDGVYAITATAEDLAGNVGLPSAALAVTIANQHLALSGATADVVVDLDAGTVTGYPGIPGGVVGIRGIPLVDLDVNGHALTVLGTAHDDTLTYTPTGAESGRLTRMDSAQVIRFSAVGGAFTVDPLGGDDEVIQNGTQGPNSIVGTIDTSMGLQVDALKAIGMPAATVERLTILALQGADTVDLTVFDTVSQLVSVDGGAPTTNPPNGDTLIVQAGSPKAKLQKQPGANGSGVIFVRYPQTTGNETRVDYTDIETTKLVK